ncbi:MAG: class I SAM-dependent methyltransferase [Nocardioides sp.]
MSRPGRRGGRHPGGGPFIESFIAPDMHMRPVGETVALVEEGGLEVRDVHALREHYVRTVDAWIERFEAHLPELTVLVGEEVVRVWRLYLVGGRMTFADGRMGVDQLAGRPAPGPSTRCPRSGRSRVGRGGRRRGCGGRGRDGGDRAGELARGPGLGGRRHLGLGFVLVAVAAVPTAGTLGRGDRARGGLLVGSSLCGAAGWPWHIAQRLGTAGPALA